MFFVDSCGIKGGLMLPSLYVIADRNLSSLGAMHFRPLNPGILYTSVTLHV
jgi:hypothetical protein